MFPAQFQFFNGCTKGFCLLKLEASVVGCLGPQVAHLGLGREVQLREVQTWFVAVRLIFVMWHRVMLVSHPTPSYLHIAIFAQSQRIGSVIHNGFCVLCRHVSTPFRLQEQVFVVNSEWTQGWKHTTVCLTTHSHTNHQTTWKHALEA